MRSGAASETSPRLARCPASRSLEAGQEPIIRAHPQDPRKLEGTEPAGSRGGRPSNLSEKTKSQPNKGSEPGCWGVKPQAQSGPAPFTLLWHD